VENVEADPGYGSTVSLACLDDDAQGEQLSVDWDPHASRLHEEVIHEFYSVKFHRIEPVGLVYLWPS